MTVDAEELATRFTYHRPHGDQPERYERIRAAALVFASLVVEETPYSREQSSALASIEKAVFWANAAIARREPKPPTIDV